MFMEAAVPVLIVLGLILVALEIFILPGGVTGLIGIILLLAGLFIMADSVAQGVMYMSVLLLLITVILLISWKTGNLSRLWRRISLGAKQDNRDGYVAPKQDYARYLHRTGLALTLLRPAGTAEIDGERVDVVSQGDYIAQGSTVRVIAVEGTRVIVCRVDGE
jgi:membrane-bound ClpP family serine protease